MTSTVTAASTIAEQDNFAISPEFRESSHTPESSDKISSTSEAGVRVPVELVMMPSTTSAKIISSKGFCVVLVATASRVLEIKCVTSHSFIL
jgi:hypothetical protein